MKKNLILLTGIVFLITILAAGGCKKAVPHPAKGPKKVIITMEAIKVSGKKHLAMYDSNNPGIVVDNLETLVNPGDTVVWVIISSWKLKKLEKIGPKTYGEIIKKDAKPIPGTKNYTLIIPTKAPRDSTEKYDIECKGWVGKAWPIDPYIRVRPAP
jgi:hypothetical protein